MILDLTLLAAASCLICTAIAYAWWCVARVTFLREELFAIRDQLWNTAQRLQAFDDPAYQAARNHLNASIRIAGLLGVPTFEAWSRMSASIADLGPNRPLSPNVKLESEISAAYDQAAGVILRYSMLYTVSGWLYVLTRFLRIRRIRPRIHRIRTNLQTPQANDFLGGRANAWLKSSLPESLSAIDEGVTASHL